jgi:hypothetical protein
MRFAHRFFVLWGSIAVLCFALSGLMTWLVVHVSAPGPVKYVGVYGGDRVKKAIAIDYYAAARPLWIVTFPPGSRDILLPYAPGAVCQDARATFGNGSVGTLEDIQQGFGRKLKPQLVRHLRVTNGYEDQYDVDVSKLQDAKSGGRIACLINVFPHRDSLTDSTLGVEFILMSGRGISAAASYIRITATIPDSEAMQVYGGTSISAGGTDLRPGELALFKYANARQEGTRDILFILIGTFIALGACDDA